MIGSELIPKLTKRSLSGALNILPVSSVKRGNWQQYLKKNLGACKEGGSKTVEILKVCHSSQAGPIRSIRHGTIYQGRYEPKFGTCGLFLKDKAE